jgi:S1-C subfamily serine protease
VASTANRSNWDALSSELESAIEKVGHSVVAVHGGRRLAASGICWKDGLVVTSDHMLRRNHELTATLAPGNAVSGEWVGSDPGTDLALIKIDTSAKLPAVSTNATSTLKVGAFVLAVGRSHLGDLAASSGIIARIGAPWKTWRGGEIDQLIRPDVTLYPGQSGGALINSQGQVLGINTSALARGAVITVPATTVNRIVDELLQHGHIRKPYLGLAMQPVSLPEPLRKQLQIDSETALLVAHVEANGPSAKAGIMLGDIVIGIESKFVSGLESLHAVLSKLHPGDSGRLALIRGGQKKEITVSIADRASAN